MGWIWTEGAASPRNAHRCFRRRWTLPAPPRRTLIRLMADSRYHLYVNGRRVARGPARYFPHHICMDEVDVAGLLREGDNLIAVHVHHFGEDTYDSLHTGQGGLWLEARAEFADGRSASLETAREWKAAPHPCWVPDTARLNSRQGFQEWYDAGRDPGFDRWTQPDFDDRGWPSAVELPPDRVPWTGPEPREVPFLEERFERFPAIRAAHRVRAPRREASPRDLAAEVRAADLLGEAPELLEKVRDWLASSGAQPLVLPPAPSGEESALLFELPVERTGHPVLEVESAAGGEELLWSYAEMLHAGRFDQGAHGEALFGDLYTAKPGRQTWETHFPRAFRYVWIILRHAEAPLILHRLGFLRTTYPRDPDCTFACSDPQIQRIWQASLDTLENTMASDAYIDSFRERAQWWGTGVMAAIRFTPYAGADLALARRGLRQAAQSQQADGQLMANFPNRVPVPAESGESVGLVLPDYSLEWILTLWDTYWLSGDRTLLETHWGAVRRLLAWYAVRVQPNGLLAPLPEYWVFLDWQTSRRLNQRAESASLNLLYVLALDRAARMAEALGEAGEAGVLAVRAGAARRAIFAHFFDPEDGFLHEYRLDGRRLEWVSLHANVLALLTGLPGLDEARLSRQLFANLPGYAYWDGADDADIGFSIFVLEAMCRTGWIPQALELIRRRWGTLLDIGLTTWPEFWLYDLHVRAGGALSVAWGVTPALVFIEWILGVQATAPGFAAIRWDPRPSLLESMEATLRTPLGPLTCGWTRENNLLLTRCRLPAGMEGRFLPPGTTREISLSSGEGRWPLPPR